MARFYIESDFYDIAYNAVYKFLDDNANNGLYDFNRIYLDMTDYVINNIDIVISEYTHVNAERLANYIAFGLRDIIDCFDDEHVLGLLYSKDIAEIFNATVRAYIIQYAYNIVVDWCTDNDF